jgi:hypothetical protein
VRKTTPQVLVKLRPVERDYVAVLGDAITPDVWRVIVNKAVELAKDGEPKAREWVTRLVLGRDVMRLSQLARRESQGITAGDEIGATIAIDHMSATEILVNHDGSITALQLAEKSKNSDL